MKKFISFYEMGYDDDFYDSTGCRHHDNRFIGIYRNHNDSWSLAYCDSTTGEIFTQDIYEYVDGKKTLVDIKLLEI